MQLEDYSKLLLEDMLKDMESQEEIYKPTMFWEPASRAIVLELKRYGFTDFRSLPTSLEFFVPTYGVPGNMMTSEEIHLLDEMVLKFAKKGSKKHASFIRMVNGEMWAYSDYRVCLAGDKADIAPRLTSLSESKVGNPLEHFCFDERWFSRSFLNYLQGLVFLKSHVNTSEICSVLEVGGGFGTLGEILFQSGKYSYVDVDIPPTAAVATYYLKSVTESNCIGYDETKQMMHISIPSRGTGMVICPWQLPRIEGTIDLFVNFISFQEMEPAVVRSYLDHVDRLKSRFVLLRNMREGKPRRSNRERYGVMDPVRGDDYDAFLRNYRLRATNVVPFGHRTVDGFHSELRLYERTRL